MYGHPDVRVLDGGWARWTAEARPTAAGDGECPLKGRAEWPAARLAAPSLVADADAVRRAAAAGGSEGAAQVVDGRSRDQYTGDERRARQAGHVPGWAAGGEGGAGGGL